MRRSATYLVILFALLVAACSPSDGDATTTEGATATTQGQAADSTQAIEATTSTASPETTTTTESALDANATVEAKAGAVVAAVPDGWSAETTQSVTDAQNEDFAYDPCLLPDDFDIDNLDDFTSAALNAMFEGPPSAQGFPGENGSIEARVFNSEADAEAAFAVFERVWGTPEGLECMTNSVTAFAGDDFPADELTFTTESVTLPGSQAGARFEMAFDVQGFAGAVYVEFQGARDGDCTVIASFISFGEPFDRDVAEALFSAALNA